MQPMPYMNHNVNSVNHNFYTSQNYYSESGTAIPLNPRIPFNACPRASAYPPFQNPNRTTNVRFQNTNVPWQSQMPQIPMRMKMPWVSLPPPPPPPPSPPANSSPGTT